MAYRDIYISNGARLSLKNNQLIFEGSGSYSFPIEDLRVLLIESQQVSLTSRLLGALAEQGVCVIICEQTHMPASVLLPMGSFSRQQRRIELQISQTKPALKQLWKQIVIRKIENQAQCLRLCGCEGSEKISSIASTVTSGDTTNREGYAAMLYFKLLFGDKFTRGDENVINAALNYGYAVFRAYISRTLAVYGLEPSFGMHHHNEYNSFNLADDLIEPLRPIVDQFVKHNGDSQEVGR